jgi:predicted ArsR family transcriptional regulator
MVAAGNGGPAPALEAQLLLDCLRSSDGPLTFSQVREALGGPPATRVRMHLRRLVDGGDVVRSGSGRRGDPYVYGPPGR